MEENTRNEARLAEWKRRMGPVIIVAAILPVAVAFSDRQNNQPAVWLDIASWLVFVTDYIVHLRLRPGYPRSRAGKFDAIIVVLTVPWYLLPGIGPGRLMSLARLARLFRDLVVARQNRKARDLRRRLSQAGLYGLTLIFVCALIADAAESASSGFDNFQDSLWWAFVTFTTVGYGDIVPDTFGGRLAAVVLMLGGIALIGSLAASLGSFLNRSDDTEDELAVLAGAQQELLAEVRALRAEIADLRRAQPAADPPSSDT